MDLIGDGKTCEEICKHAPPERDKWPCMDCDIRTHDRAEQRKEWDLKPCPFCGGEARMMDMGFPHWVYCKNCGAMIHGRKFGVDGEKASAEVWNKRSTLGIVQTADSITFTATGDAKQGEERGVLLGKMAMYEAICRELIIRKLMTKEIREAIKSVMVR